VPKVMVSLAQRRRSRSASACAACAPRGAPSFILNMIVRPRGSRRIEFLNFRHFRSFLILAHFYLVCQAAYGSGYETTVPYKGIRIVTIVNRDDRGLAQQSSEIGIIASFFPGYGY